jgi:copper chaperone CopZ
MALPFHKETIMESKTFIVPNISCGHCVHTIQNEVKDIKGVREVTANHSSKLVTVQWDAPASWADIERVLAEINYPPQKI